MLRSLLTLALSMFLLAEASAQTAPAASAKTTTVKSVKATARICRRAAKKARRVAMKTAPALPRINDGWPPLGDAQVAATATNEATGWAAGTPAASSRGEIDNANVYAAPGMPVHIRTSKGIVPYSVRPARKPAAQTTLSTSN